MAKVYLKGVTVFVDDGRYIKRIPTGYSTYEIKRGHIFVHDLIDGSSTSFPIGELVDGEDAPVADPDGYLSSFIGSFKKGGADGEGSESKAGTVFCVFAEESASLRTNAFEWSYGNGKESVNGFGIVLPFDCELIALTLNTLQGSATVEAFRNTSGTGKTVTSNPAARRGTSSFLDGPVAFSAGDSINFRTTAASGNRDGGKAAAWFRIEQ